MKAPGEGDFVSIQLNEWGSARALDIFIMGTDDPRVKVGTLIRCNDPNRTRGVVIRRVSMKEYRHWVKRLFDMDQPEYPQAFEVVFD
jgi:hypothetical protein